MVISKTIVEETIKPLFASSVDSYTFKSEYVAKREESLYEDSNGFVPKTLYKSVQVSFELDNAQYKVTIDAEIADYYDNGSRQERFFNHKGQYFELIWWNDGVYELRYWDNISDYYNDVNHYEVISEDFIRLDYLYE